MKNGIYEKLAASEQIIGAYEGWRNYRRKVTDYILDAVGSLHMDRPTVCIWGAGESNDIDLKRLSRRCRLILVDRNQEFLNTAKERYNLADDAVVLTDIPFWKIEDDTYRMFEALLADGADEELIASLFKHIGECNSGDMKVANSFIADISIAVGIHSQLNSRLAALLYSYRVNYEEQELLNIERGISGLNEAAVERLNDLLYHVTSKYIIYGYELLTVYGDASAADKVIRELEAEKAGNAMRKLKTDAAKWTRQTHMIEGAKQLAKDISLHRGFDMEIVNQTYLPWNFSFAENKKTYVMELLTCRKL